MVTGGTGSCSINRGTNTTDGTNLITNNFSGSGSWQWQSESTGSAVVDNRAYSYIVGCAGGGTGDVHVGTIVVRYEVSNPLP